MVGAHCPSFDIIPCLKGEGHHLCGGSAVLQCKCLSEGSRCKHIGRWGDIIWGPGAWSLAHWHYQDTRHDVIIHQRIIIILALLDHSVGDESHHLAHPNFIKIAINDKKSLEENQKGLFESVTDQINVESKDVKLKDIRSTLIEKKKEKDTMIKFLSENEDCPACEQHIDKDFKDKMIDIKKDEWLKALEPFGTHSDKPHLEVAPWLIVIFSERYGQLADGTKRKNYY